jgi:hypothetical protein
MSLPSGFAARVPGWCEGCKNAINHYQGSRGMQDKAIYDYLQNAFSDDDLNNWVCKGVTDAIARGSQEYGITPTLIVLEVRKNPLEPFPMHVHLIEGRAFNEFPFRMDAVRAIGRDCANKRLSPIAAFLICEAWHRVFTKEERDDRNGRQVEDYDDKQECAIVFGLTMDRRSAHARIEIKRDIENKIQFGAIASLPAESTSASADSQLLANFWRGFYDGISKPKPKGFGKGSRGK